MTDLVIRIATLDDLVFVGRDGYLPEDKLREKIAHEEVFLAEQAQEPVGYLRLEYLWSHVPYIALVWVKETQRGQGIGRAMLDFVGAWLRNRGHTVLYSSSQADEPGPQAWHRSSGFEECGFIAGINEGGVGEVFFRKML